MLPTTCSSSSVEMAMPRTFDVEGGAAAAGHPTICTCSNAFRRSSWLPFQLASHLDMLKPPKHERRTDRLERPSGWPLERPRECHVCRTVELVEYVAAGRQELAGVQGHGDSSSASGWDVQLDKTRNVLRRFLVSRSDPSQRPPPNAPEQRKTSRPRVTETGGRWARTLQRARFFQSHGA